MERINEKDRHGKFWANTALLILYKFYDKIHLLELGDSTFYITFDKYYWLTNSPIACIFIRRILVFENVLNADCKLAFWVKMYFLQ